MSDTPIEEGAQKRQKLTGSGVYRPLVGTEPATAAAAATHKRIERRAGILKETINAAVDEVAQNMLMLDETREFLREEAAFIDPSLIDFNGFPTLHEGAVHEISKLAMVVGAASRDRRMSVAYARAQREVSEPEGVPRCVVVAPYSNQKYGDPLREFWVEQVLSFLISRQSGTGLIPPLCDIIWSYFIPASESMGLRPEGYRVFDKLSHYLPHCDGRAYTTRAISKDSMRFDIMTGGRSSLYTASIDKLPDSWSVGFICGSMEHSEPTDRVYVTVGRYMFGAEFAPRSPSYPHPNESHRRFVQVKCVRAPNGTQLRPVVTVSVSRDREDPHSYSVTVAARDNPRSQSTSRVVVDDGVVFGAVSIHMGWPGTVVIEDNLRQEAETLLHPLNNNNNAAAAAASAAVVP